MELQELLTRLDEEDRQFDVETCDASLLTITPNRISTPRGVRSLDQDAFGRICHGLRVPADYLATLPPELVGTLLQHRLAQVVESGTKLALVSQGNAGLALQNPDLLQLPSGDVMRAAVAGVPNQPFDVHQFTSTQGLVQVDLICQTANFEVRRGDVIAAGLRIVHSTLGEHATWLDAFVLRLVCLNGLTHRDCVGRRIARTRRLPATNPAARQLQEEQISRLAHDAWRTLQGKWQAIRQLVDERLEVEPLFRNWIKRARLSAGRVLPQLTEAWQQDGADPTAYAALNAMTWVASHSDSLLLAERRALARLAGVLAFRHQHLCPRCFSPVAV